MPAPVAASPPPASCAYLALWPALAGWLAVRVDRAELAWRALRRRRARSRSCEWLRGWVFTGLPWLAVGYAELLPGRPLAARRLRARRRRVPGLARGGDRAPPRVVGIIDARRSCAAAARRRCTRALPPSPSWSARRVALASNGRSPRARRSRFRSSRATSRRQHKFDPDFRPRNYELYDDLVRASQGPHRRAPGERLSAVRRRDPGRGLRGTHDAAARARDGGILVGTVRRASRRVEPGEGERNYNSVVSIGAAPPQLYRKRHLVPFGESIPLKPVVGWFISRVLAIPLADQAAGPAGQPPFEVAGQRIAVNICYEDVFGAELIRVPRATRRCSSTSPTTPGTAARSPRASTTRSPPCARSKPGRPMLRATNTGITSAIAHDGRGLATLPWFTRGILEIEIAGRRATRPTCVSATGPRVRSSRCAARRRPRR